VLKTKDRATPHDVVERPEPQQSKQAIQCRLRKVVLLHWQARRLLSLMVSLPPLSDAI